MRAIVASVVLAACGTPPRAPASAPFALTDCTPLGPDHPLRCGRLIVPEDRAHPGGRSIALDIVIVPATGARRLPPLYDLAGGPGIAATGAAQFWATAGAVHRRHRDVVLVDQRGTGGPGALACPELSIGSPLAETFELHAVIACRDRLAAHADLAHYATADAVADLDAARAALGHERIDISALSYGTRLAQEYLRAHPDRVRAAVLLGALAPDQKLPLPFAQTAQAVLDELVQQCAGDAGCHAAIPDLAADIAQLRGDAPGRLWEAVRAQLTTVTSQRRLPWLLHEAAQGRRAPLLDQMTPHAPSPGANGLLLSVSCPEDTLHISDEEAAAARATVFGDYRITQQRRACAAWGAPPIDVPRSFVAATTPVLLLAGAMDHVTPPAWAAQIAAHLPNARVITVPFLGHFPDGLSHMECYDEMIAAFFEAGSAADLPVDCIATMQPPPFTLR